MPADPQHIRGAAARLRAGGLVAMPTETVYGIGADASNEAAVRRIFEVKGRPADHPLIVHLHDRSQLEDWAIVDHDYVLPLLDAEWPGPLTVVLRRAPQALDVVTGGQDTVAIRVPNHPVALDLLAEFGGGVAQPSANRFGRPSPTSAAHVIEELGPHLDPDRDLVLDGGDTQVGLESTIVDCTGPQPRTLRPGAVDVGTGSVREKQSSAPRVPGALPAHYSPNATVHLTTDGLPATGVGLIGLRADLPDRGSVLLAAADLQAYAQGLFAALRRADAEGLAVVCAVPPSGTEPLAVAIRDRLERAAAG